MLLAKVKGTLWGLSTIAVVASGAVVLAQSGGGSSPAGRANSEADRQAAMEKKLDRIISALDKLSGAVAAQPGAGAATAASAAGPAATQTNPARDTLAPLVADLATPAIESQPQPRMTGQGTSGSASTADVITTAVRYQTDHTVRTVVPPKPTLYDRLSAAEREISVLRNKLERIERRLAEIDKRVGQASASDAHQATTTSSYVVPFDRTYVSVPTSASTSSSTSTGEGPASSGSATASPAAANPSSSNGAQTGNDTTAPERPR